MAIELLDEPAAMPTLFKCYKPIEQHIERLRREGAEAPAALDISPLDAFLMHQLVAFLPEPTQLVDLVADVSAGASTALCTAHPNVRRVIVALDQAGAAEWRDALVDPERVVFTSNPFALDPLLPIVFLAPSQVHELRHIFEKFPDALVLLLPLGRLGQDRNLADMLAFCDEVGCHLTAFRDLAPFFHGSDLGLLWRGRQPHVDGALARLRQMYEGNFQFVDMAQSLVRAAERERDREENDEPSAASSSSQMPQRAYRNAVDRIRKAVAEVVPPDSTVIVVSRGDDDLLNLGGRRAWHFPQTRGGIYAGHHPADSAAAIAHLEELRARGANVLLLPVSAFWWLRHYSGFARHLEQNYRLITREEDACALYALDRRRATDREKPSLKYAWDRLRDRFRGLSA